MTFLCMSGHFIQFLERFLYILPLLPWGVVVGKHYFSVQIWIFHASPPKIVEIDPNQWAGNHTYSMQIWTFYWIPNKKSFCNLIYHSQCMPKRCKAGKHVLSLHIWPFHAILTKMFLWSLRATLTPCEGRGLGSMIFLCRSRHFIQFLGNLFFFVINWPHPLILDIHGVPSKNSLLTFDFHKSPRGFVLAPLYLRE